MYQNDLPASFWRRKGHIDIPMTDRDGGPLKFQFPTLMRRTPDRWRLFLAARGADNAGRMVYADLAPRDGMRVLGCGEVIGPEGAAHGDYDADGIGPSCVFEAGGETRMAATGVQLRMPAYDAGVGFLRSGDGGETFRRAPDLGVFHGLPPERFAVGPDILLIGGLYHMWYAQGAGWRDEVRPYPEPTYHISHATSETGRDWVADSTPAVGFAHNGETGITRPCVRPVRGAAELWEMWYCYRGKYDLDRPELRRYRIGYARSRDLVRWERLDMSHVFVDAPQPGDFDAEMQCYPTVVQDGERELMFYCGYGYGLGGVGYAERVRAP